MRSGGKSSRPSRGGFRVRVPGEAFQALTKRCPACRDDVPVERFSKRSRNGDGLRSRCREHENERATAAKEFRQRYPAAPVAALLTAFLRQQNINVREFSAHYAARHEITTAAAEHTISRVLAHPEKNMNEITVDRIACSCGVPSVFLLDPGVVA